MADRTKATFLLTVIVLSFFVGCTNAKNNSDYDNAPPVFAVDYVEAETKNGVVFIIDEQYFKYRVTVFGRSNNAAHDRYYIVLTNDENITFQTVDRRFWGSYLPLVEDFRIVEHGLIMNDE